MDTAQISVLIGGLALIAFTLWFFFGKLPDEDTLLTSEGQPIYECPMHPWIVSADPGANCSVCGMNLIRRGAGSDAARSGHDSAHH